MPLLPYAEEAILELRKLEGYCLDPGHPRGRHKARVFREVLGIGRNDAQWLRNQLLDGVRRRPATEVANDLFGSRWRVDVSIERHSENGCNKDHMDHTLGRENAAFCDLLGALKMDEDRKQVSELDVVALLADLPAANLARGQVGTVVELLDETNVLVEFSGDDGRPYAIASCSLEKLLVLHYAPEAIA